MEYKQEKVYIKAIDILREGAEKWKTWIKTLADNEVPDLSGENLSRASGISLKGVYLNGACLIGVNFTKQNLQHHHFFEIDLSGSIFKSCNLSGSTFSKCNLSGCDFSQAVLGTPPILRNDFYHIKRYSDDSLRGVIWAPLETKESLHYSDYRPYEIPDAEYVEWKKHIMGGREDRYGPAKFESVDLTGANLNSAICDNVDFSHLAMANVNLEKARLKNCGFNSTNLFGAIFLHADLTGADLHDANLEKVDFRFTKNVVLDGNNVNNTRFDPNVKIGWLSLRRDYTGIRLAMTSVALLLFLSPYIFRFLYYDVIYKAQQIIINGTSIPYASKAGEQMLEWEERSFLPYIFGWYESPSIVAFNILLFLYNLSRAILTIYVSRLREEESRSGYTPSYMRAHLADNPYMTYAQISHKGFLYVFGLIFFKYPAALISSRVYTYHWLLPLDKFVKAIFWVAIASLLFSAINVVNRTIFVPV